MKRLILTLFVITTALMPQTSVARSSRASSATIPSVETINKMINYFTECCGTKPAKEFPGMKLIYKSFTEGSEDKFPYMDEEIIIYGNNVKYDKKNNKKVSTSQNAWYFEYGYYKNDIYIVGFKIKKDRDKFVSNVKKSKYYKQEKNGISDYTMFGLMYQLGYDDGWHWVSFGIW